MKVILHPEEQNEQVAVLKLYDRRYCPGLRENYDLLPWTHDLDEVYFRFISHGDAHRFISRLESHDVDETIDDSDWDDAKNEVWVQKRCRDMWRAEIEVYDRLADLQGSCVPRLYHSVTSNQMDLSPSAAELFKIPGILIEFIDGFNLKDVTLHTPQSHWQHLCDQAIGVISRISNHDVLNQDVRRENIIVRKRGGNVKENGHINQLSDSKLEDIYDIFAIDFGLSRLRRQSETDDEWKQAKFEQYEDRNIGLRMKYQIRKSHGVELKWHSTRRLMALGLLRDLGQI